MNIFVLDINIKTCARYHCDRHVVKMILESAQMLSTVCRLSGIDAGYGITHANHPCSKWARESLSNWRWLRALAAELNTEYRRRYGRNIDHKSMAVIESLPEPAMPDIGLTPFAQAMPDDCKGGNAVRAYRKYYRRHKRHIATWRATAKPKWYR